MVEPQSEILIVTLGAVFFLCYCYAHLLDKPAAEKIIEPRRLPPPQTDEGEPPAPEGLFAGGMVRCPACKTIHPAGVLYCHCGTETEEYEPEDEETERVCVHEAPDLWKARQIANHLADHCIFSEIEQEPYAEGDLSCTTRVRLFVAVDDEADALAVLGKLRR